MSDKFGMLPYWIVMYRLAFIRVATKLSSRHQLRVIFVTLFVARPAQWRLQRRLYMCLLIRSCIGFDILVDTSSWPVSVQRSRGGISPERKACVQSQDREVLR